MIAREPQHFVLTMNTLGFSVTNIPKIKRRNLHRRQLRVICTVKTPGQENELYYTGWMKYEKDMTWEKDEMSL